jgi:hypothetical protein
VCSAATAGGKSPCQIKAQCPASKTCDLHAHDAMTREEFKAVLEKIDSKLRALPATAQVGCTASCSAVFDNFALQQGSWRVDLLFDCYSCEVAASKLPCVV